MNSDDDYYEDEYSGYGHTADPNLDRWDSEEGGIIINTENREPEKINM